MEQRLKCTVNILQFYNSAVVGSNPRNFIRKIKKIVRLSEVENETSEKVYFWFFSGKTRQVFVKFSAGFRWKTRQKIVKKSANFRWKTRKNSEQNRKFFGYKSCKNMKKILKAFLLIGFRSSTILWTKLVRYFEDRI